MHQVKPFAPTEADFAARRAVRVTIDHGHNASRTFDAVLVRRDRATPLLRVIAEDARGRGWSVYFRECEWI
jgi:hypothetical protein